MNGGWGVEVSKTLFYNLILFFSERAFLNGFNFLIACFRVTIKEINRKKGLYELVQ